MKIIHFCAGLQFWNGMANTARQFIAEEIAQGHESFLTNELATLSNAKSGDYDIVYIHGAWLPVLWRAAKHAKRINAKLIIRPAGSYDPVRLGYHSWKKKLVAFFERRMLRRADVLLGTCEAEVKWIKDYVGEGCPKVEITDLKRFFDLKGEMGSGKREKGRECGVVDSNNKKLNVLYLGRRHPLKGVKYLEFAVEELNYFCMSRVPGGEDGCIDLRIVSDAKGEELEKVWDWCDVLVLPTLSENFGRVVAEALERGKCVVTTDGAPAWGDGNDYGGRLMYLKGYRDGNDEARIKLLRDTLMLIVG